MSDKKKEGKKLLEEKKEEASSSSDEENEEKKKKINQKKIGIDEDGEDKNKGLASKAITEYSQPAVYDIGKESPLHFGVSVDATKCNIKMAPSTQKKIPFKFRPKIPSVLSSDSDEEENVESSPVKQTQSNFVDKSAIKIPISPRECVEPLIKIQSSKQLSVESPKIETTLNIDGIITKEPEKLQFTSEDAFNEMMRSNPADFYEKTFTVDTLHFFDEEKFAKLESHFQKSLLVQLISKDQKMFQQIWRLEGKEKILTIKEENEIDEETMKVVGDFIKKSLNHQHPAVGLHIDPDKDLTSRSLNFLSLYDKNDGSLLNFSIEQESLKAVEFFLKKGFDVTYDVNGNFPVDFLNKKSINYEEILFALLKANSPFPKSFDESTVQSDNLKIFLNTMKEMHKAINMENIQKIEEIIKDNKSLSNFFLFDAKVNLRNISAFKRAQACRSRRVIEVFMKNNIFPASFETSRYKSPSTSSIGYFLEKPGEAGSQITSKKSEVVAFRGQNNGKQNEYELSVLNGDDESKNQLLQGDEFSKREEVMENNSDLNEKSDCCCCGSFFKKCRDFYNSVANSRNEEVSCNEIKTEKSESSNYFSDFRNHCIQNFNYFRFDLTTEQKFLLYFNAWTSVAISDSDLKNEVYENFKLMLKDKQLKKILDVFYYKSNYKIFINENKNSEEDPSEAQHVNGYSEKNILINVGGLNMDEIRAKIVQKLCHFAMFDTYKNQGKPYEENEEEVKNKLRECVKDYEKLAISQNELEVEKLLKTIIKYPENFQDALLISIVPYLKSFFKNDYRKLLDNNMRIGILTEIFSDNILDMTDRTDTKKNKKTKRLVYFLSITSILLIVIIMIIIMTQPKTYKWLDLADNDKDFILNRNLKFFNVDVKLNDLITKNSSCLKDLKSEHIAEALIPDKAPSGLIGAATTYLSNCIYFAYHNMTSPLKRKMKESSVHFQGNNVKLLELLGENSKIYENLQSDEIKSIFSENLRIGEELSYKSVKYVDRKFIQKRRNKEKELSEVMDASERLFILADETGAGKTSTLRYAGNKLKESKPKHWIFYTDFEVMKGDILDVDKNLSEYLSDNILKLTTFEASIFNQLYHDGRIIFIWDNFEALTEEEKIKLLRLFDRIKKETKNHQLIAVNRENSREFEKKFNVISHEFVPLNKKHRTELIQDLNGNVERIELYIESKLMKFSDFDTIGEISFKNHQKLNGFNDITSNNPLILTLMAKSSNKKNYTEIFSNLYRLFDEFHNLDENSKINHQKAAITSIFKTDGEINQLFDEFEVRNSKMASLRYKRENPNVNFFHPSFKKFYIVQFFFESFFTVKKLSKFQIEQCLNLLLNYSNFHDDKIVRNLIKSKNTQKIENLMVKEVIKEKFSGILTKINSNQSLELFIEFFKNDREIMQIIGNPDDWLEINFNISTRKSNFRTMLSENSTTWRNLEENNQKGIIFYQIWTNRKSPSLNSILSFTEIPLSENFLLDLLAAPDYSSFFKLASKYLNRNEISEFFNKFGGEISSKFAVKTNEKDISEEIYK